MSATPHKCACVPEQPELLPVAGAAHRLCNALVNGEAPDDVDIDSLRWWSEDLMWLRVNGQHAGPHHYEHCPMYLDAYPSQPSNDGF